MKHLITATTIATLMGNTLTIEDAYRFAKGEALRNAGGELMQLSRPLDFVAITDPEGNVMAKEIFQVEIAFNDNRRRVGRKEEIEPFIPYQGPDGDFTGYRVLIGFQLPEQVEFNKRYRR